MNQADLEIKYVLYSKTNRLPILDRPRPRSEGGNEKRYEAKGARLFAYEIVDIEGVPYASLVPRVPGQDEWVRVSEAGSEEMWCKVVEYKTRETLIADALNRIADALEKLEK